MSKKNEKYYTNDFKNFVSNHVNDDNIPVTKAVKSACKHFKLEYNENVCRSYRKRHEVKKEKPVPIEESKEYLEATKREVRKSKAYFITWAQAETAVHKGFLENLEAYANLHNAEIIVQAGRYKNPNSIESNKYLKSKEKSRGTWDASIRKYLYANRISLNSYLSILADVKVQPTAVMPLSGLGSFTGRESSILPHPKVQLESLPILDGYKHKLMLSTGAVTVPNYTDTKAGKKGEFHHQIGFVVAEIFDNKDFQVRQIQADDDGSFMDLHFNVRNGSVSIDKVVDTAIWGDLHFGSHDEKALCMAEDLSDYLDVERVIIHDAFDGESVSHHISKNPFQMLNQEEKGTNNLENELTNTIEYLGNLSKRFEVISIESNHNDFLDRWLINNDWRKVHNKKLYLELAHLKALSNNGKGVFHMLLEDNYPNIKTVNYGGSYIRLNTELGTHGDRGTNGSRGGIKQFKNLLIKTITGHSHSPRKEDGATVVGTLTKLRLGYNDSWSTWVHGIVLLYKNGKNQHIHLIGDKISNFL